MIREYALANDDLTHFVTLTLDARQVERYDPAAVIKKMRTLLDNRVRRRGWKYILVPELHKDGAIHFHGFVGGGVELVDSGTLTGGPAGKRPRRPRSAAERSRWLTGGARMVYNIPGWTLGFSSAIALDDNRSAAIAYVGKYVTKSLDKIGGRWYYHSGNLLRAPVLYADLDYSVAVVEADYDFGVPETGARFAARWVRAAGTEETQEVIALTTPSVPHSGEQVNAEFENLELI